MINPIVELPFGRNRKFAKDANPVVNALIGDWSVSAQYQWQIGRPLDLGGRNVYFNGDPKSLKVDYSGDPDQPVFDISGFYFHDAAVQTNGVDDPAKQRADTRIRLDRNIRTFPSRTSGLRAPNLNYMDVSFVKAITLAGRVRAQLHFELYNAFNQVFYSDPNTDPTNAAFGKVTQQSNLPVNFQIGTKITF